MLRPRRATGGSLGGAVSSVADRESVADLRPSCIEESNRPAAVSAPAESTDCRCRGEAWCVSQSREPKAEMFERCCGSI
jgi:hypothetical protein